MPQLHPVLRLNIGDVSDGPLVVLAGQLQEAGDLRLGIEEVKSIVHGQALPRVEGIVPLERR